MANVLAKLRAIAWTALQETMRRKVFYIGLLLLTFILIMVASSTVTMEQASEAGETTIVVQTHTQMIESIFEVWNHAVIFLALYLGAVAMYAEVTARTIPNVLSRPVQRSTYLTGRWLGTLAFLWTFELVGWVAGLVLLRVWAVPYSPLLWVGCAGAFVAITLSSGLALALSVGMHPALAGVLAYLIPIVPDLLGDAMKHPRAIVHWLSTVGYYLAPASMPVDLVSETFDKQLRHPAYALYTHVLLENLAYVIVVFVIACAVFRRRELRLR